MKIFVACLLIIFSLGAMDNIPPNLYFCKSCTSSNTFYSSEEFKVHLRQNHLKITTGILCLYDKCKSLLLPTGDAIEQHMQVHMDEQDRLLFVQQEPFVNPFDNAEASILFPDLGTISNNTLSEDAANSSMIPNQFFLEPTNLGQTTGSDLLCENEQQSNNSIVSFQGLAERLYEQQQLANLQPLNKSPLDSTIQSQPSAAADSPSKKRNVHQLLNNVLHQKSKSLDLAGQSNVPQQGLSPKKPEKINHHCACCGDGFRFKKDYMQHLSAKHRHEYCWACEKKIEEDNLVVHFRNSHPQMYNR